MCGICGYINFREDRCDESVILNMIGSLHHRGPDSSGKYLDAGGRIGLGHTRLSIIDISDNGSQPMHYQNLVIVFNGEIYNYKEIKQELVTKGHSFNSDSDTEVILHSFHEWGADCVKRFIGIFAFVIYDKKKQSIYLFRDRAGVKPLFYYTDENVIIFASELKAFHKHPLFKKEVDQHALALFIQYGYIPTPYCIFKNAHKLLQGSYLKVDLSNGVFEETTYWDLKHFYDQPKLDIGYEDARKEVENLLLSSFNYRMVSDVPVGVFLSAGFDSTCVTALLQKDRTERLKTFTIGFDNGNNEAPLAREIASFLGTDHTEYYCNEQDALEIVKDLPYYYDEPFADSSSIPTILVSRIARKDVTVALSADGGDEIFAGYNSYDNLLKAYNTISKIPEILYKPSSEIFHQFARFCLSPEKQRRFEVLSQVLKTPGDLTEAIMRTRSKIVPTLKNKLLIYPYKAYPTVLDVDMDNMDQLSKVLYADYVQYMQDDILVKVDRATMSVSLEGRDPFLDQRIIEFTSRLPSEYKYHNGEKKYILKDIVYQYVPKALLNKPKTGFSVPLNRWLSKELKCYTDEYLSKEKISNSSFFNYSAVYELKEMFAKYPQYYSTWIWRILQYQMWFDMWM